MQYCSSARVAFFIFYYHIFKIQLEQALYSHEKLMETTERFG